MTIKHLWTDKTLRNMIKCLWADLHEEVMKRATTDQTTSRHQKSLFKPRNLKRKLNCTTNTAFVSVNEFLFERRSHFFLEILRGLSNHDKKDDDDVKYG